MEAMIQAAAEEIADAELYKREAELFRREKVAGEAVAPVLAGFAAEERSHMEVLLGMLSMEDMAKTKREPPPRSRTLRDALRAHLERELRSIRLYEAILRSPLKPRDRLVLKGILAEDREHLDKVVDLLKHLGPDPS
ncbi:MAG: ferritin-like domain-containing protein [Elusimicrobia bacterium]|nr:ferritin-like domain-containing protein [Elusimicrobiota bacterium]